MGCTHPSNRGPIKMTQLSHFSGSDRSTFFIDKKRKLWKKRIELIPAHSIDIEIRNFRIMNLEKSEYLLQPVNIIRTTPLTTFICMEYAGPDLYDYMRVPFNCECVQRHLAHIRSAVHFLHNHGIAHRDIKPENVVFHKGIPKLIDWDFSSELENFEYCGTTNYMVDKSVVDTWICSNTLKSKRMDVYAFGKLILAVLLAAAQFDMIEHKSFILDAFFHQIFSTNPYEGEWGKWTNIALECCKCVPPDRIMYI